MDWDAWGSRATSPGRCKKSPPWASKGRQAADWRPLRSVDLPALRGTNRSSRRRSWSSRSGQTKRLRRAGIAPRSTSRAGPGVVVQSAALQRPSAVSVTSLEMRTNRPARFTSLPDCPSSCAAVPIVNVGEQPRHVLAAPVLVCDRRTATFLMHLLEHSNTRGACDNISPGHHLPAR